MDWYHLKENLQNVLNEDIDVIELPISFFDYAWIAWNLSRLANQLDKASQTRKNKKSIQANRLNAPSKFASVSIVINHDIYFFLSSTEQHVVVLKMIGNHITNKEKHLIELIILSYGNDSIFAANKILGKEQLTQQQLVNWLIQSIKAGNLYASIPEELAYEPKFFSSNIPMLLYTDFPENQQVTEQDLKKLLETFFDYTTFIIPLESQKWLVFVSDKILDDVQAQINQDALTLQETIENKLEAIAQGLHEMLLNEWLGQCQLAIYYPIVPANQMVVTLSQLNDSIRIGRRFHPKQQVYAIWQLYIEKLMIDIPDLEKEKFIDEVIQIHHLDWDDEMMLTIDCFVNSNCNVSQTAKKLYIHRNTLLYRLDKFKQMTNHDVRNFNHVVLVKIALLLYKFTKS